MTLEVKKSLVESNTLEIKQSEVEDRLFVIMKKFGYSENFVK